MSYKHSLYLWPIENAHTCTLYSKMVAVHLAPPTDLPTAKGLLKAVFIPEWFMLYTLSVKEVSLLESENTSDH